MKKEKPAPKKRRMLFDPDKIATAVHQALERDFREAQHVYCLNDRSTLVAFNRQVNELRKKYVSSNNSTTDLLEELTYQKFLDVNAHMAKVEESLKSELPKIDTQARLQRSTPMMEKIHRRARALVHSVLGPLTVEEWFTACQHSGGSTQGVPYRDCSMERKFLYPLSVTKKAKPWFDEYMAFDRKLKVEVDEYNLANPIMDMYKLVPGSRATTVDKNDSIRRMIAVEATCNMFLQQGLMLVMYDRMRKFGLDVEFLPTRHQQLAYLSSITSLDATIDWSSASDCSARELLRWLLPPMWFSVCDDVRSESITINGEEVALNMFSTMGNAVTFPLETLVFWAYAHATRLTEDGFNNSLFPEWEDIKAVSVFGDDCIVPTSIASKYIDVMESVGFIINKEKSFYGSEQFRESCGVDYLDGFNVRPFNLRAPSSTRLSALEPWLYIMANALISKYMMYFGRLSYVYDKELWRVIFGLFQEHGLRIKLVPPFYPDDSGLKLSHDIQRFAATYRMKLNTIGSCDVNGAHGSICFNYLRFVYWDSERNSEGIRLFAWLKKPSGSKRPIVHEHMDRDRGGYVVAKGITGHWSVPVVRQVV